MSLPDKTDKYPEEVKNQLFDVHRQCDKARIKLFNLRKNNPDLPDSEDWKQIFHLMVDIHQKMCILGFDTTAHDLPDDQ